LGGKSRKRSWSAKEVEAVIEKTEEQPKKSLEELLGDGEEKVDNDGS
jgi:hypothetical protein